MGHENALAKFIANLQSTYIIFFYSPGHYEVTEYSFPPII